MPRKTSITYVTSPMQRPPTSEYYLATTSDRMQFYCFEEPSETGGTRWTLINELDRTKLLAAGSKETAKAWAKRLNLRSWTYVRV